jgi:hypothetical protein
MRHEYHDRVSLEIARRIASDLPSRPDWITLARENLNRWSRLNRDSPGLLRSYDEWRALLDRPLAELCELLTAETSEGQRLRQNSPFAGALPPETVWDIKRRVRDDQTAA